MTTANMTFVDTSNNFYDAVMNLNIQTNNLLGIGLLVALFFFVFSKTIDRGTTSAFIVASFATSIVAVLMWFIQLTEWYVVTLCVLTLLASVLKRAFD